MLEAKFPKAMIKALARTRADRLIAAARPPLEEPLLRAVRAKLGVQDVALRLGPSAGQGGYHFTASYTHEGFFGDAPRVLRGYSDARGQILESWRGLTPDEARRAAAKAKAEAAPRFSWGPWSLIGIVSGIGPLPR